MKLMTGVPATHIPYKGTGPAMTALLGQEYHFNFAGIAGASRMVAAGKLKGLAVSSAKRTPAMPDTPTVAESGLPGFEVVGWYGVIAPPKMSKPLLAKIHAHFVKTLREPQIEKAIFNLGNVAVSNEPEAFRKFMLADLEKWRKVVAASGAKAF
jgi:tripartite-type tricarboxylate transporter receptor subunit TctC